MTATGVAEKGAAAFSVDCAFSAAALSAAAFASQAALSAAALSAAAMAEGEGLQDSGADGGGECGWAAA